MFIVVDRDLNYLADIHSKTLPEVGDIVCFKRGDDTLEGEVIQRRLTGYIHLCTLVGIQPSRVEELFIERNQRVSDEQARLLIELEHQKKEHD